MNTTPDAPTDGRAADLRDELYGDLLSLDEAAFALNISRYTLAKKIGARQIPTMRIGRRSYVRRDDLSAYITTIRKNGAERGTNPAPAPESAPTEGE